MKGDDRAAMLAAWVETRDISVRNELALHVQKVMKQTLHNKRKRFPAWVQCHLSDIAQDAVVNTIVWLDSVKRIMDNDEIDKVFKTIAYRTLCGFFRTNVKDERTGIVKRMCQITNEAFLSLLTVEENDVEEQDEIDHLVRTLCDNDLERRVLELRYLQHARTEIAAMCDVKPSRVRRILQKLSHRYKELVA
jgi:DNA-directed RNA polymerase specialized sigma24 family protein